MATEQRIYKVTGNGAEHLVQATSQAQALRHVAGKQYAVDVAKAIDVAQLMSKGIKIELASAPAPEQLEIK
jgi:ribosome biogenesis SPOUT family RNA methylase Rps3